MNWLTENWRRIVYILILISVYFIGKNNGDPNRELIYGSTGLPRNCRAIVKENYEGWEMGGFTADDALASINRNCGADGYSWGLR